MTRLKIIFLIAAVIAIMFALLSSVIYDWGTSCARKWGWNGIVEIRERHKHWALPFSQIILILLTLFCLLLTFLYDKL